MIVIYLLDKIQVLEIFRKDQLKKCSNLQKNNYDAVKILSKYTVHINNVLR